MAITTRTLHRLTVPELGSIDVSVGQRGAGDAFLMLHGGAGPGSVHVISDLIADTAGGLVITPTHPGFAGTIRAERLDSVVALASVYEALLAELGLRDVTVVGNSIGGWVAAEMALRGSARIGRVVLVDATGIEVPGHRVADIAGLSTEQVMQLSYHDPDAFPVDPSAWTPATRAAAANDKVALSVYGGRSSCDPDLRGRLSEVDLPVLVIWGESDRIVDPDYGRAYADSIPRARFHLLPAAGHVPQIETPRQLLGAISLFIDDHRGWSHRHTAETEVAPQDIWATLRDLYTGTKLSEDGDTIEIHGPFRPGTRLTATPPDSDTVIECTISGMVDGQMFEIESEFGGLMISSRHVLAPLDGGGTRITHDSTITGPRAGLLGSQIGPRITADHPAAMDTLIAAAGDRVRSL